MKNLVLGLLIVVLSCTLAMAQSTEELLESGKKALEKGDYAKAYEDVDDASIDIWMETPFDLATVVYTTGKAAGYGLFQERENNVYPAKGESIYLYMEPVFYKWQKVPDDKVRFGLILDLYLLTKDGELLYGKEDFMKADMESRRLNREFMLNVTLDVSGLKPGEYQIKLLVKDRVSGEMAERKLPLVIK